VEVNICGLIVTRYYFGVLLIWDEAS
jgi:hypothetical protein